MKKLIVCLIFLSAMARCGLAAPVESEKLDFGPFELASPAREARVKLAPGRGATAETFAIEKDDARPFRIHGSPDETKATYALMEELAAEIRRVTGVQAEVLSYAPSISGDIYVSTQPWGAKGSYAYGVSNGVLGIHGADVEAT